MGPPFEMIVKAHFVGFCFFFCCRGEILQQLEKDSKGCFVAGKNVSIGIFWNHPWNGNPICSQPVIEVFVP